MNPFASGFPSIPQWSWILNPLDQCDHSQEALYPALLDYSIDFGFLEIRDFVSQTDASCSIHGTATFSTLWSLHLHLNLNLSHLVKSNLSDLLRKSCRELLLQEDPSRLSHLLEVSDVINLLVELVRGHCYLCLQNLPICYPQVFSQSMSTLCLLRALARHHP